MQQAICRPETAYLNAQRRQEYTVLLEQTELDMWEVHRSHHPVFTQMSKLAGAGARSVLSLCDNNQPSAGSSGLTVNERKLATD